MSELFIGADPIAMRLLGTHRFEEPDLLDVASLFPTMLDQLEKWINFEGSQFSDGAGHHYGLGVLWAATGGEGHAAIECQADQDSWMCVNSCAHDTWAYALVVLLVRFYQIYVPEEGKDSFWANHAPGTPIPLIHDTVLRYAKLQWEYYSVYEEFGIEVAERYQELLIDTTSHQQKWLGLFLKYAEKDLVDLRGLHRFIKKCGPLLGSEGREIRMPVDPTNVLSLPAVEQMTAAGKLLAICAAIVESLTEAQQEEIRETLCRYPGAVPWHALYAGIRKSQDVTSTPENEET